MRPKTKPKVPQPIKTKANVPMSSAKAFFMASSPEKRPISETGLSYLQVRGMIDSEHLADASKTSL